VRCRRQLFSLHFLFSLSRNLAKSSRPAQVAITINGKHHISLSYSLLLCDETSQIFEFVSLWIASQRLNPFLLHDRAGLISSQQTIAQKGTLASHDDVMLQLVPKAEVARAARALESHVSHQFSSNFTNFTNFPPFSSIYHIQIPMSNQRCSRDVVGRKTKYLLP
jgi:hypothetical protein